MIDILSSKLYRSSTRKSQILGAIQDPTNSELVRQLKTYLDDEFIDPKYLRPSDNSSKLADTSSTDNDASSQSDSVVDSNPASFHSTRTPSSVPGETYESDELDSNVGADASDDTFSEDSSDDTEQADSKVASATILSCVSLDKLSIDALKGTFNSREDCAGVSRIAVKDSEIWVYYSDDVNLNNVMSSVVELVANLGITYLEFNRLARSNNAIVFDILKSTDVIVKESE